MKDNEIEYLKGLCKNKFSPKNPFIIKVNDDEEIIIISSGDDSFGTNLDPISKYKTIYDSIFDLTSKIVYSMDMAIDLAYTDKVQNEFHYAVCTSKEEWESYYLIENALFRIEALWDMLAQIYNIKCELGKKINEVYHNRIFSYSEKYVNEYWKKGIPDDVRKIIDYINEQDNDETDAEMYEGNYRFINMLRNSMTHKYSISRMALSSYAMGTKHHPSYIIKRGLECFDVLQEFLVSVIDVIIKENSDIKLWGE